MVEVFVLTILKLPKMGKPKFKTLSKINSFAAWLHIADIETGEKFI